MRGRAFGGEGMRVGDWECQKDDDDDRALLFRPSTRLRVFVPAYFRGVWQSFASLLLRFWNRLSTSVATIQPGNLFKSAFTNILYDAVS